MSIANTPLEESFIRCVKLLLPPERWKTYLTAKGTPEELNKIMSLLKKDYDSFNFSEEEKFTMFAFMFFNSLAKYQDLEKI